MQKHPIDDIDAVLGRFQAWTSSTGSQNTNTSKEGIRELSYEEALRSSQYRRRPVGKLSAEKAQEQKTTAAESAPSPIPQGKSTRHQEKRKAATKSHLGGVAAKTSDRTTKSPISTAAVLRKARAAKNTAASTREENPKFRDVLADTISPTKLIVPSTQPIDLSRPVNISVRLAATERDLIKARAAESGISASAYIRQCTLEVEQLRAQVQQKLATMDCVKLAPARDATSASRFFVRLARRFFPKRAPTPALRA
jgi:hypothetical protein